MFFKRRFKNKRSKKDKKDDVLRDNYDDELDDEVTEDTDVQSSKKSHAWSKVFRLFSFDSHRKLERFILTLFSAIGITVIGFGVSLYHNYRVAQQQSQTLTSTSSNIVFSKSGSTLSLANLISSPSGKTVYLPINFGDMTELPGSADHFSLFLSATDGSLKYKPYGQILMYGTTGYGMLIFHSETGFKNQPVTIYLKNNVNFTGNQLGNAQSDSDVASLQRKYDIAVFKLNLAAKSVTVNKNLPDGNAKPDLIYNAIFSSAQRKAVMSQIASDKSALAQDIELSVNIYQQLGERGYQMPEAPEYATVKNWRPYNQVNPVTGRIGKSNQFVNSNGKSAGIAKQKLKFPDVLYRKSGDKLIKMDTNSTDETSPDLQSWEKLQSLWTDIYNRKYDMYVKQYAQLYSITQTVFKNGSSYSVSSPSNFTLLGDVSVR